MIFPRYPNYKPSDVDWLGEVPADWEITRMKYVASLKGRLGWQNLRADEYTEEGPFLVTSEHLSNDRVDWDSCYHVSEERYAMAPEIQLRAGDLLMMKDGAAMGKLGYIDQLPGPACLNSHLLLFRPRDNRVTNRFLYYVLGSPSFTTYMLQERTGSTFFGISQEDIGAFRLALPPQKSLHAIVSFLDRESAKIDGLVAEQQRLIELLKEKGQAVISHAATGGLNPDAPLRRSGIEWLGDVPAHWRPTRLRWMYKQEKRQGYVEKQVLSVFRDFGVILKASRDDNFNKTPEDLSAYQLVNPGDLVVNKMKAWQGSLGVSRHEGITSPDYVVFAPIHAESSAFLHYLLRSRQMVSTYRSISNGIRPQQWRLEPEHFLNLRVFLPPREEQQAIARYIDGVLHSTEALVSEAARAIALLQERRAALISAAVTGKVDVRGLTDAGAVAA